MTPTEITGPGAGRAPSAEFNLEGFGRGLKRSWKLIALSTVLVMTAALGFTLFQPYVYSANTQLVVQTSGGMGDLASMASQFAPGLLPSTSSGPNLYTEVEIIGSDSILSRVVESEHLQLWVTDHARTRTLASRINEKVKVLTGQMEPPTPVDMQDSPRPITFLASTVPASYEKAMWRITRTGETSYRVTDEKSHANLGDGTFGVPFEKGDLSFTIGDIAGALGDEYSLKMRSHDGAIRYMRDTLSVWRTKDRADLISISFPDTSPVIAKYVTNAVADSYLSQSLDWESELAKEMDSFLEGQITQSELDLTRAQTALNDYRAQTETVMLSKETEGLIGQLTDAQLKLATQNIDTQQLQYASDRLKSASDRDFVVFLSGGSAAVPVQASMVEELNSLIARRDGMLTSRTSEHPEVMSLNAQISAKKSQILSLVDNALSSARQRQGLLAGQVGTLETQRMTIPETETQLSMLNADVQLTAQLLQALKQRKQTNELTQAAQESPIRILDRAIAPLRHSRPSWSINMLLGFLVGSVLGLTLAVGRVLMDTSIRTRAQAEALGLPVVAQIPKFTEHLRHKPVAGERCFLALRHDPLGPVAESFRILRSATNMATGGAQGRVLGITSSGIGEGKTVVTLNLATMFAQAGFRTLVIDTDLRRPAVARSFGLPQSPGLSEVLEGKAEVSDVLRDSGIAGLTLMSAGGKIPNPSELLLSDKFQQVLQSLRRDSEAEHPTHFDVILLDLPPVEAVSETIGLGRLTTALYLLVRSGRTPYDIAADVLRRLSYARIAVRGLILNEVSRDDLGSRAASYLYYNYTDERVEERGLWNRLTGGKRRAARESASVNESDN